MARPEKPRPWTSIEVAGIHFHYSFEDESRTKLHIEQYGKSLVDAVRLWKHFQDEETWNWNPKRKRFDGFTETELLSWGQEADALDRVHVYFYTCMDRSDPSEGE